MKHSPDKPSLSSEREDFLKEIKDYFRLLTKPLIDLRTPQTTGKTFVGHYSRMVDTVVGLLFHRAAAEHGRSPESLDVAVIAAGGYGRSELAPYSDVDILIVCKQKSKVVEQVSSSFIRLMWDAGFELGHAVESLVENESALARDMDKRTALIESRWVCGSREVAGEIEKLIGRVRRDDREAFLRKKIDDGMVRYRKEGGTYQLIEPSVKVSPGGMRDYQTLVWLGQVDRTAPGLSALRKKKLLLRGEQRELEAAYDFLTRVRVELHLATRSKQDRLTVRAQRRVAKALGYRSKGHRLDVEYFMRDYYMHTRAIFRIYADVIEALGFGRTLEALLGTGGKTGAGNTMTTRIDRRRIRETPLRVFEKQKQTGLKLDRRLRRRLEVVLREDLAGRVEVQRMRRAFPRLLEDDRNLALVVRSMHEAGFLGKIIPEYNDLTCLKRYDLYHHYTVDEHSFRVLENLLALGGEPAPEESPLTRLYSELADRRPLFLAALLHDIGKIKGRGHATKGAVMAGKILKRLRLPTDEIELVQFLIRNHLLMSHFSQRRDPSDLDTISAFCKRVKNRTNLKLLCLLTYADLKATSPEVWTAWKRTLLWELYARAYMFMEKKEKQPEAVYKTHKKDLLSAFKRGAPRDRALAHLDLLPGGYLLTMDPNMVETHLRMVDELDGAEVAVDLRRRNSVYEVTFCTDDRPYLLSMLCGVLAIHDCNILHALAFTRSDGKVIDVFSVVDARSPAQPWGADEMAARRDELQASFTGVVARTLDLEGEVARHREKWRRTSKSRIPIDARVEFENDLSVDFTIIDIFAQDAPGLLYKITQALSREGLTIYRANISTEANRAIDSFYVADENGRRITAADRLERIRGLLTKVVG